MIAALARYAAADVPLVGLSLLHFIWQGALIALALKLILSGAQGARARYLWAMTALTVMAITPPVTFVWLSHAPRSPAEGFDALLARPFASPVWRTWQGWLVGAWAAGVVVLSLRAAFALRAVTALRRRGEAAGGALTRRFADLADQMAPGWRVNLRLSSEIDSPVVIGWLKPVVLLPLAVIARAAPEDIEALLLHELAHVRRWDAFANAFQIVIESLLFYHPAVWWASRVARDERENCCDDLAVAMTGDPVGYVRALADMAQAKVAGDLALGAAGGSLLQRARRQLIAVDLAPQDLPSARAAAAAALLTLTAMAGGMIGKASPVEALISLAGPVRQIGQALSVPTSAAMSAPRAAPLARDTIHPAEIGGTPPVSRAIQAPPAAPVAVSMASGASQAAAATSTAAPTAPASAAGDADFERAGRIYQQIAIMRSADQAYDEADNQLKDREAALERTLKQVASLTSALIYPQPTQLNSVFLSDRTTPATARPPAAAAAGGALPVGSARKRVDQAKLVAYLDAQPIGRLAKDEENELIAAQAQLQAAAAAQQAAHDQLAALTSE